MNGHALVRMIFELESGAWHGHGTERLWAQPVGGGRYKLRNVPFFAYGVSHEDIVFGAEREGQLYFKGVSIRGGHATYRLRLAAAHPRDSEYFERHWRPLQELGCTYEEGAVIAIDVPPGADIHKVFGLLQAGEAAKAWDFEEAHCGHAVASPKPTT